MLQLTFLDKVKLSMTVLLITGVIIYIAFIDGKCGCSTPSPNKETFVTVKEVEEEQDTFFVDPYTRAERFDNYQEGFQEGFKFSADPLGDVAKFFTEVGNFFSQLWELFTTLWKKVVGLFLQIVNNWLRFVVANVEVGYGIEVFFKNFALGLGLGFKDIFNLIGVTGNCFVKYVTNFRHCSPFWFLDFILSILKAIFWRIPIQFLKNMGVDLEPALAPIFGMMDNIDCTIHGITGFHFLHYPDWAISDCYSCDYQPAVDKIITDWDSTIPNMLNEPKPIFEQAGRDYMKMFTLPEWNKDLERDVIPQLKETGQELGGNVVKMFT